MKNLLLVLGLILSFSSLACEIDEEALQEEVIQKTAQALSLGEDKVLSLSTLYVLRFQAPPGSKCEEARIIYHGVYVQMNDTVCAVGTKIVKDQNRGEDSFKILSTVCE